MYRGVDTLVHGCTHYPLLKGVIQDVMNKVCLVDSAIETAKVVRDILEEQRAKSKEQRAGDQGRLKFYVTDSTEKFVNVGERFLGKRIDDIEKINLGR